MKPAPRSSYRFVIAGLVLVLQVCLGLSFVAPSPILPLIMKDLHIESTTASLLTSSTPLMIAFFMVPSSLLAPRIGVKRLYGVGALLMAAGCLAPLASSFPVLFGLRLVFGLGAAVVLPTTAAVIVQWFNPREIPAVNGLNIVGQSIGNALPMFLGVSIAQSLGWPALFALPAALSLLSGIAWFALGKEPADHGKGAVVGEPPSLREMAALLRGRNTLLLGLGLAGAFGQNVALSSWLPTYYNKVMQMPLATAGLTAALLPLFGIGGSFLGGYLPVRLGLRRPILMASGGLMMLFAFGTFSFPNEALILVSVAVIGVMSWVFVPSSFTVPMELPGVRPQTAAMSVSVAIGLGNVGAFIVPLLVGYLADRTGSYSPGLIVAALIPLSLLFCGYLLPETGPKARKTLVVSPVGEGLG